MDISDCKSGLRVKVKCLSSAQAVLADPKFLALRREGNLGHLDHPLKGYPDFWWVWHLDGTWAPYEFSELETSPDERSGSLFE